MFGAYGLEYNIFRSKQRVTRIQRTSNVLFLCVLHRSIGPKISRLASGVMGSTGTSGRDDEWSTSLSIIMYLRTAECRGYIFRSEMAGTNEGMTGLMDSRGDECEMNWRLTIFSFYAQCSLDDRVLNAYYMIQWPRSLDMIPFERPSFHYLTRAVVKQPPIACFLPDVI